MALQVPPFEWLTIGGAAGTRTRQQNDEAAQRRETLADGSLVIVAGAAIWPALLFAALVGPSIAPYKSPLDFMLWCIGLLRMAPLTLIVSIPVTHLWVQSTRSTFR